ncbi:hypothetical protein R3P38DRAFT_2907564, partial [Favolaschia claudopus]
MTRLLRLVAALLLTSTMSWSVRKLAPHLFSKKPASPSSMAQQLQVSFSGKSGHGSDKSFVVVEGEEPHVIVPPLSEIPNISSETGSARGEEMMYSQQTDPMSKRIVGLEINVTKLTAQTASKQDVVSLKQDVATLEKDMAELKAQTASNVADLKASIVTELRAIMTGFATGNK